MALHHHLVLAQGQRFACGNAQLPLDQIQTRDRFSDRMLHLQTGVHLHEEKVHAALGLLDDELHRACAQVIHRFSRGHCCGTHARTQLGRQARCG